MTNHEYPVNKLAADAQASHVVEQLTGQEVVTEEVAIAYEPSAFDYFAHLIKLAQASRIQ